MRSDFWVADVLEARACDCHRCHVELIYVALTDYTAVDFD